MKSVLRLRGLDCAHCAAELEEKISNLNGVQSAVVSFVNGLLTVEYDGEETLERIIAEANAFEEVRGGEELEDFDTGKKRRFQWFMIAFSALFFVGGILLERFAVGVVAHYICYALAYFAVGYPVLINTGKNIVKGKIFDENFIMTIASIGAA